MKARMLLVRGYDGELEVSFTRPSLAGSSLPKYAYVAVEVDWDEQAQELTHRYSIWQSRWVGNYYTDSWSRAKEKALELIGCDGVG